MALRLFTSSAPYEQRRVREKKGSWLDGMDGMDGWDGCLSLTATYTQSLVFSVLVSLYVCVSYFAMAALRCDPFVEWYELDQPHPSPGSSFISCISSG